MHLRDNIIEQQNVAVRNMNPWQLKRTQFKFFILFSFTCICFMESSRPASARPMSRRGNMEPTSTRPPSAMRTGTASRLTSAMPPSARVGTAKNIGLSQKVKDQFINLLNKYINCVSHL